MGLETFYIFLNETPSTGSPGDAISGAVVIHPGQAAMQIQALLLNFKGNASVYWVVQKTVVDGPGPHPTTRTETAVYVGLSNILDSEIYLLGDGHGVTMLPPGENVFPFNFPVDFTNVPGTFIGEYGKVEYVLEATLKGPFADFKTKRDVHVTPLLDLNLDPALAQSREIQKSKTFCCLCCASGPLTMTLKLGATGYCVGEGIPILVEVNNASTRKIKRVTAQLIRETTYTATNGRKQILQHYPKETSEQKVGSGNCEVWQGNVGIPLSVVPTRLGGGCKIIDVQYYLKVVARVNVARTALKLLVPITIGTVPITNRELNEVASPASPGFLRRNLNVQRRRSI